MRRRAPFERPFVHTVLASALSLACASSSTGETTDATETNPMGPPVVSQPVPTGSETAPVTPAAPEASQPTDPVPTGEPPPSSGGGGAMGTGGTAGAAAGGMGGSGSSVPLIDGSRESLIELLESEAYKESSWRAQTDGPREASSSVSPHGDVRVFANDILLESIQKGNAVTEGEDGMLETTTEGVHDTGSAAVKEFYTDGELVGRATFVKLEGAQGNTAYYCEGSADRCGTTSEPPIYGIGFDVPCGVCHGGLVFTVNFPEE